MEMVLVPFYRGAVVFIAEYESALTFHKRSRPLLSRSGCISNQVIDRYRKGTVFSSPFIEERLYFERAFIYPVRTSGSRPLLSRSGCMLVVRS